MPKRKDSEKEIGIDQELARLRYPEDTKEHLREKIEDYRQLVQDTLTSLKGKYSQESEISHFKRIQEFCMQANVIFGLEDDFDTCPENGEFLLDSGSDFDSNG